MQLLLYTTSRRQVGSLMLVAEALLPWDACCGLARAIVPNGLWLQCARSDFAQR